MEAAGAECRLWRCAPAPAARRRSGLRKLGAATASPPPCSDRPAVGGKNGPRLTGWRSRKPALPQSRERPQVVPARWWACWRRWPPRSPHLKSRSPAGPEPPKEPEAPPKAPELAGVGFREKAPRSRRPRMIRTVRPGPAACRWLAAVRLRRPPLPRPTLPRRQRRQTPLARPSFDSRRGGERPRLLEKSP